MDLSGYALQPLREDGEFTLYRGCAEALEPSSLLLLTPTSTHPTLETLKKIDQEYSFKGELERTWAVRPFAIAQKEEKRVLLLEDPGGEPLHRLIQGPMEIRQFLRIAIGLAAALGQLHKRKLIHKDVKPSNVLVDAATGQVWLTGFGIASRLPRERQAAVPHEVISGTLAYMAPEQTGRMNRSIDSRSDLYALGVTLYEMLTGTLPFTVSDPMELMHCHIARQPTPPGDRLNGVPGMVSATIMKLLAKTPEERHQTAAGVEGDLRRCLEWETHHRIGEFALCREHELLIPHKLYGRDREVEALLASFDRIVKSGVAELVLVSGYSGVGKSSVAHELHKVLVPPRGLFASGKFDQYKRDIPYATLAQAFQNLLRPLLTRNEEELGKWRHTLREALEPNGQLIVDLVPEVKLIIGEQPPVPPLPLQDAQRRFQLVFRRFIGLFAQPEHPLALFLDDLQWLDSATLDLIEDLLTQSAVRHLLLIGAYRDNEVNSVHPLMGKLEAVRRAGTIVREIVLAPLGQRDLAQLIADSLHSETERVTPLARLVHDKTAGNPFFAIQFIYALAEEGLLSFKHGEERRWFWDLDGIHAKGYTDNVVDLMAGKLNRLPEETQNALRQLACLGNSADFSLLQLVSQGGMDDLHARLWEAVRAGLILRTEHSYRFLHDRVQEAAYSLIPEESRAEAHLRIGRLLADSIPRERREEKIFEIVNHLNRGAALITSCEEREQLAELNLIAGKRAKASTAYASALNYLIAGKAMLEDAWERRHDLAFLLELYRAECEFLTAQSAAAEERLTMLASRAANTVELATVTCLRVDLYTALDENNRAVATCLDYLRHLGVDCSPHPTEEEVQREYDRIWSQLGSRRKIEELLELPLMSDPESLATLDVLTKVLPAALFTDANLLSLAICKAVNLSLERGNSDGSCVAYVWFGQVAGPHFGNYRDGFRFGQLGYELVEKRGLKRFQARTYMVFGSHVMPWTKDVRAGRDLIRRTFEVANAIGDLCFAVYSCINLNTNLLAAGDPLGEVQREVENGFEFARKAGFGSGFVTDVMAAQLGLIRTLRGLTAKFGSFDDEQFNELRFERHLASDPVLAQPVCFYWIRKLQAGFFAADYVSALDASLKAQPLLWTAPSNLELAEYHLISGLCHAALWDSSSPDERQQHFEALAGHHRQLEIWADHCPENFENRAALVRAEVARIQGNDLDAMHSYQRSVRSAHANGFIHIEAVAYELAARFYAARGFETIAEAYLREARYNYLRWGADGKVRQLDSLYPQIREEAARDSTSAIVAPVEILDLATILKVSHALPAEMVLDKLIDVLMRSAIEHAGAGRGLLILQRGNEQRVVAEALITGDSVTVSQKERAVTGVPDSIVHFVTRAREPVILDDAAANNPFSADPHIREHHPRSILCLPLINQAKLVGVLYLENNLAPHVFTPKRTAVLKLLASQAAISLENTRLYSELEEREAKVRQNEAELRQVIETIPAMVWTARPDGSNVLMNRRWIEYTGSSAAGMGWQEAVHPDDLNHHLDVFRSSSTAGLPFEDEVRFRRADGEYRWFLVQATPMRDDQGNIIKWYGIVTDIEDRKRAEGTLREQASLLGLTHDAIFVCDMSGILNYWNRGAQELYGWTASEAIGNLTHNLLRTIYPVPREEITAELMRAGRWEGELVQTTKDGRQIAVSSRWSLQRDKSGSPMGYLETNNDITERKRVEESLKRSETYLAQAQRVAHIGSWVFDALTMKPVYLSEEWYRLQGFDPKDGMPNWAQRLERVYPEDRARYEAAFMRAIAEKSDLDTQVRILLPSSELRYIRTLAHPVLDASGHVVQLVGVTMDVTESRQAEEERERLRRAQADLAHISRVSTMGELTASLAHELKQPIGAAVTNAEAALRLLNRDLPDIAEAREAAFEAVKDATRAADIIDRVHSLYTKGSPRLEMLDANEVIEEMASMLDTEADQHSVIIRAELAQGLPQMAGDRVQLQQVLMNLMLNGIEAMRITGGVLTIKSQLAEDGDLLISVSDTGVGLPAENRDQIFNAFFTTKSQGTGLGLAITRSIIESHGGRVWATANSGRGATFQFTLPGKVALPL